MRGARLREPPIADIPALVAAILPALEPWIDRPYAMFGHSMGAWVCIKALEQLPTVKKGFALSTWNIGTYYNSISPKTGRNLFMLNTTLEDLYNSVDQNKVYFNLLNDNFESFRGKHIFMIDEHKFNSQLAETIKKPNPSTFEYLVWQTDHSFTNKRVALMKRLVEFLNR